MRLSTFFNDINSGPLGGLVPTFRVRESVGGALTVTDSDMTEVGDGFYTSTFSEDPSIDYVFRADAGVNSINTANRFTFGVAEEMSSLQAEQIQDTLDFHVGRFETNSETGLMTLFNAVDSPLYVSSIFIDTTATLPYDGTAINRRSRATRLF